MIWLTVSAFALVLGGLSLLVVSRAFRSGFVSSRSLYLVGLVGVPALAVLLYALLGSSADLRLVERLQAVRQMSQEGVALEAGEREALVQSIRRRAEQTDSVDYWYLLANQYLTEGRYDLAVEAFERTVELSPEDVSLKAALAEAMFLAAGNRLTAEVRDLVTQVRTTDPGNVTINGLLGITAFQLGEWQRAIDFWETALAGLPPMSANAQAIRSSVERAREMLGEAEAAGSETGSEGTVAELEIEVSLDPSIQAPPDTTVFVFARSAEGVAMPIAVKRMTVADLPAQVTLSDDDAMVESLSLSRFQRVDVVARLSYGGTPTPGPDDLEALVEDLPTDTNIPLELVIGDPVQ